MAGALVLAMWMLWPASPSPSAEAPAVRPRGGGASAATQPPLQPVGPVKLEALTAERQEPSAKARNPFRYQPKAPPPPRPVAPPTPSGDGAKPAPTLPTGPPPPPPIPLKFIGILERANGVKWAVLSDGKVTLHGKDGDNIDGRYRIVKIGTESIEMTYLDGRGRQVIRLTGQ